MTVNPDIVHSRKFIALAKELCDWMEIDWSKLYAQDKDSVTELRDLIVDEFVKNSAKELMGLCPLLVDHLLENKGKEDWAALAIAVDNQNGMYHPLRLTKMVMGATK